MPEPIIVRDPQVMSGEPCIRGTRIPARFVTDAVHRGTTDVLYEQFPYLPRFTAEDIEAIKSWPIPGGRWDFSEPNNFVAFMADGIAVEIVHSLGSESFAVAVEPQDIPALIAALTEAHQAYTDWLAAVEQWERDHA